MNFYRHKYELCVVLGNPASIPIWHVAKWNQWYPLFTEIRLSDRGNGGIWVNQIQGTKHERYGRLGFTRESCAKWLHSDDDTRLMESIEIYSPSWNKCSKSDIPPDIFVSIGNELAGGCYLGIPAFNPLIIAARRKESRHPVLFEQMIRTISSVTGGHVFTNPDIRWAVGFEKDLGVPLPIDYLGLQSLFRRPFPHERPIDEKMFYANLKLRRYVVA